MHPILFRRERFLLYLSAWAPITGILGALVVRSGTLSWTESYLLTAPLALMYAFVCLTSFYLCRSFPLRETGYARLFVIYVAASVLSSSLWILALGGWAGALRQAFSFPAMSGQNESVVYLFFLNGILLFLLAVFMHYLMIAVEDSRKKEQHALTQSVLAREAELRALRAQIHPHFLFNSLNSISALTSIDPGRAREMSIRLAEFLRKTLTFGASERVTLSAEIALIEDYLAIEQTRFGERMSFRKDVTDRAGRCLIPSLLLQPLLENAVNHGIASVPEGGNITLRADTSDSLLRIVVENPVDPEYVPSKKGGLGLDIVRRRLSVLHGPGGKLRTETGAGLFRTELVLPEETAGSGSS